MLMVPVHESSFELRLLDGPPADELQPEVVGLRLQVVPHMMQHRVRDLVARWLITVLRIEV